MCHLLVTVICIVSEDVAIGLYFRNMNSFLTGINLEATAGSRTGGTVYNDFAK